MKTVGVEALLRWQHPNRERWLRSIAAQVASLEESGLILPCSSDVGSFRKPVDSAPLWHAAGLPLTLSVNVSACDQLESGLIRHRRHGCARGKRPAVKNSWWWRSPNPSILMRDCGGHDRSAQGAQDGWGPPRHATISVRAIPLWPTSGSFLWTSSRSGQSFISATGDHDGGDCIAATRLFNWARNWALKRSLKVFETVDHAPYRLPTPTVQHRPRIPRCRTGMKRRRSQVLSTPPTPKGLPSPRC